MADLTEPAVWVRGVLVTRLQILSYLKLRPHMAIRNVLSAIVQVSQYFHI